MSETLKGFVSRVIDGDTLSILVESASTWVDMGLGRFVQMSARQEQHVRLARINAPENSTAAGQLSTAWVRQQLTGIDHVDLDVKGFDKFHRLLCRSDLWRQEFER